MFTSWIMNPESVESIPHWLVRMSEPASVGFVVPFTDGSLCMKVAIFVFLVRLFVVLVEVCAKSIRQSHDTKPVVVAHIHWYMFSIDCWGSLYLDSIWGRESMSADGEVVVFAGRRL